MRALLALMILLATLPARAEEVVLGLSRDKVSITTSFDGSEILIFGAVKRQSPLAVAPLQVIVTVEGPSSPVVVRRKERRFGIWVNTAAVAVDRAPAFYSVATSAPWRDSLTEVEDLRHRVSIPRAIRQVGAPAEVGDAQVFTEALIRIREADGQYHFDEGAVVFRDQTLFNTAVALPANLTEGIYRTRIFLTREGRVVSTYETAIEVNKVGLERMLYAMSRQQPLLYGLLSLAIAIAAGWAASAVFRLIRQG